MPTSSHLLRQCGKGSDVACALARHVFAIYAGTSLTFSDAKIDPTHPNKLPFTGCLLLVDEASQKPPHGSQGHRIYVAKNVAKNKLSGLIGMGVNYSSDLEEHATRKKVGVVTKAWLEANKVMVSGFIWDKDFPEAKQLRNRKDLGMSMELADVYVEEENASVWNLEDFEFTGATILKKDAAAYTNTTLNAKAATGVKGEAMAHKVKEEKKKVAARREPNNDNQALLIQAMGGTITTALQNVVGPLVQEIKASHARIGDQLDEFNGRLRLTEVHAAADASDEDDDEVVLHAAKEDDDSDMEAAKEDDDSDMEAAKEDDDSDMEAAQQDDASEDDSSEDASASEVNAALEDMGLEDASEDPGEVNKDAKNKGKKTTVTTPPKQGAHFKGNVAEGRLKGRGMKGSGRNLEAAAVQIETLMASNRKFKKALKTVVAAAEKDKKRYKKQITTINASLERFAELEGRRSAMPMELTNLASKSGFDLGEIKASGQKLTVEAVDTMFAHAKSVGINIDPAQRIGMKMLMEEQGIMDQGVVDRGYGRA